MTRWLLILVLGIFALPVQAGEFWNGLWRNADQRAEALLRQGDANNAAKVYADPQRKAYAKLQAGDYQGAAKDLAEVHGSDADYNRGNALAHAGDLQGALEAYDAALKSDPNNQDAKYNRELVENALKQQPPQQQKSGDKKSQDGQKPQDGQKSGNEQKSGDEKKDGQQGKESSDKEGSSDQDKKDGKDKQGEQSGKDKTGQQGQSGENKQEQSGKDGQKPQNDRSQNEKNQNDKGQAGKNQDGKQGDNKPENGKQTGQDNNAGKEQQAAAKDDAEKARRDAEASLAMQKEDGKNGKAGSDELDANKGMQATAPKTEKQIAQEQWLRSIPEDPGGLLRRKFMIEHMMKQQKAQQ